MGHRRGEAVEDSFLSQSIIEVLKSLGFGTAGAGVGAFIFYLLKRKVIEEDTAASRSSAENDMIQHLRDEVARLYDRNNTLMERNTMLQEQIDALRSEIADLRLKVRTTIKAAGA